MGSSVYAWAGAVSTVLAGQLPWRTPGRWLSSLSCACVVGTRAGGGAWMCWRQRQERLLVAQRRL